MYLNVIADPALASTLEAESAEEPFAFSDETDELDPDLDQLGNGLVAVVHPGETYTLFLADLLGGGTCVGVELLGLQDFARLDESAGTIKVEPSESTAFDRYPFIIRIKDSRGQTRS